MTAALLQRRKMIEGKKVVVTGKIAGESRQTAEAKLRDAGATVQAAVTEDTDLLVIGAKVGASKIGKATIHGVEIVPWEQAFSLPGALAGRVRQSVEAPRTAARTVAPMLAKAGELPTGDGWLYEVKWDGYRGIATVIDSAVSLQSRSGKSDLTEQFPQIAVALSALPDCVLDGELVVLDGNGNSSFESMGKAGTSYIVFDLLELMGQDVRDRTLDERRGLLRPLLDNLGGPVSVSPSFDDGASLLAWAANQAIEGIVAKRRHSTYKEGSRTGAWLKIKLRCEQEFVVVGWKPGEGARAGRIGSLLLAVNDEDGLLRFVGRVGTGGTDAEWDDLLGILDSSVSDPLERLDTCGASKAELRDVVWVKPDAVVQVRFQRWTEDGRLWHPSVQGVRTDKTASEVVREPVAS